MPTNKTELGFNIFFSNADAEKLLCGYKPVDMEDKWFVYSENTWVYFIRSWTGHYIFGIELSDARDGKLVVTSSWVNADTKQYRSQGREQDCRLLSGIIKGKFGVVGTPNKSLNRDS
ncbi:hypothetical protein [Vibrio europaeus]|uniref:hypothetical protein n=1 Tax=Vibrio europaeus TaxID=300876 RepID=UPI00233ECB51|nr:hypothetical protein [Vibrio europaeus]MDC5855721.1 hypothetical protein [Vibrio europaeus]